MTSVSGIAAAISVFAAADGVAAAVFKLLMLMVFLVIFLLLLLNAGGVAANVLLLLVVLLLPGRGRHFFTFFSVIPEKKFVDLNVHLFSSSSASSFFSEYTLLTSIEVS